MYSLPSDMTIPRGYRFIPIIESEFENTNNTIRFSTVGFLVMFPVLLLCQEWKTLNPSPWSNTSSTPFFLNEQRGWFAGHGGNILATTDAGASWSIHSTKHAGYLSDISFVDEFNGWVVEAVLGESFLGPGYFVSSVGIDEETIRKYVKYQEKEEKREEHQQGNFRFL